MKNSEVLLEARKLIHWRWRWCQNEAAKTLFNQPIPVYSPKAFKFCAIGALRKVWRSRNIPDQQYTDVYCLLSQDYIVSLDLFNDSHSHREVLELFHRAIDVARYQESQESF